MGIPTDVCNSLGLFRGMEMLIMAIRARERRPPAHNTQKVKLSAGGEIIKTIFTKKHGSCAMYLSVILAGHIGRAAPIHPSHGCSPA